MVAKCGWCGEWTHYVIVLNQLEKLEAAKADSLVCISSLSPTGSFLVLAPHMHKVTIYNKYFLFLLILTHHYPRNDVSQHHQQHVVPGNRVHFRSVIH